MRDCDLINKFADFLKYEKHRAERTIESYKSDIEQFLDFLGTSGTVCERDAVYLSQGGLSAYRVLSNLGSVRTDKVRAFMDYLHDRQYSQASIRRKLATLICLYGFLHSEKLLDFNPTSSVKVPGADKRKSRILTDEQIWKLVHLPDTDTWLGARDRAMLELLCSTGIRVSELTNLDVDDVDIDNRRLRITSQAGKTRPAEITTIAAELIGHYLNLRPGSPREEKYGNALFINKFGKRLDTRSADRRIAKYIEMAGLGRSISPYDLRHSFAKKLLDQDTDVEQLRQKLGFESASSAKSYADTLRSGSMELQQTFFN